MKKSVELDEFELELIKDALAEKRKNLLDYLKWVDDRPMLPAREVAIGRIIEESQKSLDLWLKLNKT